MAERCHGCYIKENYKYWCEFSATKHQFFKVMLHDDHFNSYLGIPTKFSECFKEKQNLAPWCTLIGASKNKWRVKLSKSTENGESSSMSFTEGWTKFVNDNGVEPHDLLVFRYAGSSSFEVSVFDQSGCEREGTHFARNPNSPRTTCNSTLHGSSSNNEDSKETLLEQVEQEEECDNTDDMSWEESDDESEDCVMLESKRRKTGDSLNRADKIPQIQKYYISERRKLTQAEEQRASKMALQFMRKKSENRNVPVFHIKMLPTHVYHGFHLTVPMEWAKKHMLKEAHEVELRIKSRVGAGRSWTVGCKWTLGASKQCQLRAKWPKFALENNLEEHDVCVFQLIQKGVSGKRTPVFDVYIFRAIDDIVPLSVSKRLV